MTYKSSNSMPSHSARRSSTRTRPSLPSPSSSAPPSNYSSSTQHVPSTPDYITSSPAFGINQTVNITVEISSSSTPAYNGYDVRNYAPPVTTTCYSTEPSSSSSASTSSYQYSMYDSISNFPNYSFNPPSPADATTSSSSPPPSPSPPLQGYTPSASIAASANYSYYDSEGYASEHYGSQSEHLGNQPQGEEEAEHQVPHAYPPSQVMLRRFLTVDSEMDSLAYLARIAIRRGDVKDGEVPLLPSWGR